MRWWLIVFAPVFVTAFAWNKDTIFNHGENYAKMKRRQVHGHVFLMKEHIGHGTRHIKNHLLINCLIVRLNKTKTHIIILIL